VLFESVVYFVYKQEYTDFYHFLTSHPEENLGITVLVGRQEKVETTV
jgi:hypothetical protein